MSLICPPCARSDQAATSLSAGAPFPAPQAAAPGTRAAPPTSPARVLRPCCRPVPTQRPHLAVRKRPAVPSTSRDGALPLRPALVAASASGWGQCMGRGSCMGDEPLRIAGPLGRWGLRTVWHSPTRVDRGHRWRDGSLRLREPTISHTRITERVRYQSARLASGRRLPPGSTCLPAASPSSRRADPGACTRGGQLVSSVSVSVSDVTAPPSTRGVGPRVGHGGHVGHGRHGGAAHCMACC